MNNNSIFFTSKKGMNISKNGILLSVYNSQHVYNIPNDLNIREIGNSAFKSDKNLVCITIPENTVSIGTSAFERCHLLEYVYNPFSLERINNNACRNCNSLKIFDMTAKIKFIGESAFENCISLPKINIPFDVKYIGHNAFKHCISLKEIVIKGGAKTYIEHNALDECKNLETIIYGDIKYNVKMFNNILLTIDTINHLYQKIKIYNGKKLEIESGELSKTNDMFIIEQNNKIIGIYSNKKDITKYYEANLKKTSNFGHFLNYLGQFKIR